MHIQHQTIRGSLWIIAGSLFCPCHLPITVPLALGLVGGTALGGLLESNLWVVGGISTMLYLGGLVLGFRSLRQKNQLRDMNKANELDAEFACCVAGEQGMAWGQIPSRG